MTIATLFLIAHDPDMARAARAKLYLRIRRWVDRDLATPGLRTITHMIGFIPVLPVLLFDLFFDGPVMTGAWILAISLGVACSLFVLWRGARLMKALSIRGDRDFDRRVKFTLAPEHQRSESVTAAGRRNYLSRRKPRPPNRHPRA